MERKGQKRLTSKLACHDSEVDSWVYRFGTWALGGRAEAMSCIFLGVVCRRVGNWAAQAEQQEWVICLGGWLGIIVVACLVGVDGGDGGSDDGVIRA